MINTVSIETSRQTDRLLVNKNNAAKPWTGNEKIIFRIAFIFFMLMALPTSWSWVERVFAVDLSDVTYRDLYDISGFNPRFITINSESGRWGLASYANWGVVLLTAILGGLVWTFLARKEKRRSYNDLYYWLRVVVRYRIAIGLIAFGFIKLFPQQMPPPSLAVQDTDFGDFQAQKLYWYSVGIVQHYEIFLGAVEITSGLLMFWKKTVPLGAALTIAVLFNIGLANHAYDGGVHIYSFYFVVLAVFLLVKDFPGIWKLIVKEQDSQLANYEPRISSRPARYAAVFLKAVIIFIYVPFFTYVMYANNFHETKINKNPINPGLTGARGNYRVTEFRVNNKIIPYSPMDSVRWQTATFEKWSTLTFKVNKPVSVDIGNGSSAKKDVDKDFELAGIAGGRRFFYYDIDTTHQVLRLQDKNVRNGNENQERDGKTASRSPTARRRGSEKPGRPVYTLHYDQPSPGRIILNGRFENKDSIYIVLDKFEKASTLLSGRNNTALNDHSNITNEQH